MGSQNLISYSFPNLVVLLNLLNFINNQLAEYTKGFPHINRYADLCHLWRLLRKRSVKSSVGIADQDDVVAADLLLPCDSWNHTHHCLGPSATHLSHSCLSFAEENCSGGQSLFVEDPTETGKNFFGSAVTNLDDFGCLRIRRESTSFML